MPPRCHQSKKEAIFQLCNFLCTEQISDITDLADGRILFKTLQAKLIPIEVQSSESIDDESNPATKKDIFLQHIKKFIDDHYSIQSQEIIEYEKLKNSDELETLKIVIFVLSEIIKHLLEVKSNDLSVLYHLDVKSQTELESIFKLFITERQDLTKDRIEKMFSKTSKVMSVSTPLRRTRRHKENGTPSTPKEDVFTSSPLKTYFESPVFKNEGPLWKEKLKCLEKTVAEGDEQISNLEKEKRELEDALKNKEKDLQCSLKKLQEKEEENTYLMKNSESLKAEIKRISDDLSSKKSENDLLKDRIFLLSRQIEELQKFIIVKEEEPKSNEKRSSEPDENKLLNSKDAEISELKEHVKSLEIKNISYQRDLRDEILEILKKKGSSSPEPLNSSYEATWQMMESDRLETQELLSAIITADNKELCAKLSVAQYKNQQLHEEIENLKMELAKNNQRLGNTEIRDSAETEKFRQSSNEASFSLNNSDCLIQCEQSAIISECKSLQCSEKSPEAVLWKSYDETENTYDINLNQDSVMTENLNIDLVNDLTLNNIEIKNLEPDILQNVENNYVIGNLNFNAFLNELKKLTKNGSFQKVLQVFKKEANGTNGHNQLDLQKTLQIITDCVCVVAESSLENQTHKCCYFEDKKLCIVAELNIELDKLKNELIITSEKQQNNLIAYKSELEVLKHEKMKLENKYQTSIQVILKNKQAYEELCGKFEAQNRKIEALNGKYRELKKSYEHLLDENKRQKAENNEIRRICFSVCKKKSYYEKLHTLSQAENTKLKGGLEKLKEEVEKLKEKNETLNVLQEKEACLFESAYMRYSTSRDSCVSLPNHSSMKPDTYQETANESVLSGVFHKNMSHYVSENEEDFSYFNSLLDPLKKEYDDERIVEIKRRNSMYPLQLQSSYPLEVDLNTTYHSLYVQDKCSEEPHSKKLKLSDVITEEPIFQTPISKPKKKIVTPSSFQRLMRRVKYKRMIPAKPKGQL